jgi:hypothetical protein
MPTRLSVLAIFLGSFLLFGIQPMLSRTLLPSFGGVAAVWTCCLAAYQVLLLVGYGYAHWLAGKSLRTARTLHLGLLVLSVLWLFGVAAFRMTIKGFLGNMPIPSLEILLCVQFFIGLPYVLLSANSTLLQAWLARSAKASGGGRTRDVYRLYAVSNLGSLLGLLLYPFVLEPFVSLTAQWYGLAAGLFAHTILLAVIAKRTQGAGSETPNRQAPPDFPASDLRPPTSDLPPPLTRPWLWFTLPALSAFLLNAVTMHLSVDVMPVPMLWVLLLTAFLLSYILGFSGIGEKGLLGWAALATGVLLCAAYVNGKNGSWSFLPQILIGVATVFTCGSFLHAWLYHIRPETERLTHFYLCIAAGGAFGGVCASVLAPVLFDYVLEYPLALTGVAGCCAWLVFYWPGKKVKLTYALLLLALAASLYLLGSSTSSFRRGGLFFGRNFYGCLRLLCCDARLENGARVPVLQMVHDSTLHGMQALDAAERRSPTTYYGKQAGGLSLLAHPKYGREEPMRVGLVGLGAGTLACYGRTNDLNRFFEINPMVVDLATDTNLFTFLADSPAQIACVVGDARKRLEEERLRQEPKYDVLIIDAYTGDYVPLHLATQEAFALYVDRLAPDGILALHISNWHMDLLPLCKAVAQELQLHARGLVSPARGLLFTSHWVFLSRPPLNRLTSGTQEVDWLTVRTFDLPSDEKGNLLSLIDLKTMSLTGRKP